jgi:hypothetical protein
MLNNTIAPFFQELLMVFLADFDFDEIALPA